MMYQALNLMIQIYTECALQLLLLQGGLLQPAGDEFSATTLRDARNGNRPLDRQRWAIKPFGFMTCKKVMYCANVPQQSASSRTSGSGSSSSSDTAESSDSTDESGISESEAAEQQEARSAAAAQEVLAIGEKWNLTAVAVPLSSAKAGQVLAKAVMDVMPYGLRRRDPKVKKAQKAKNKGKGGWQTVASTSSYTNAG
jgi:hypothetical protein